MGGALNCDRMRPVVARIGRGQQHGLACRLKKHGADAYRDLAYQPQGVEHAARTDISHCA